MNFGQLLTTTYRMLQDPAQVAWTNSTVAKAASQAVRDVANSVGKAQGRLALTMVEGQSSYMLAEPGIRRIMSVKIMPEGLLEPRSELIQRRLVDMPLTSASPADPLIYAINTVRGPDNTIQYSDSFLGATIPSLADGNVAMDAASDLATVISYSLEDTQGSDRTVTLLSVNLGDTITIMEDKDTGVKNNYTVTGAATTVNGNIDIPVVYNAVGSSGVLTNGKAVSSLVNLNTSNPDYYFQLLFWPTPARSAERTIVITYEIDYLIESDDPATAGQLAVPIPFPRIYDTALENLTCYYLLSQSDDTTDTNNAAKFKNIGEDCLSRSRPIDSSSSMIDIFRAFP